MANKLSREFKVGVFGVFIIISLYLGINYIQNNRLFSSDKVLYGVFSSSDGLEASAPVLSKGFRVGTVEDVDMDMSTGNIIVTISVMKEYSLTDDSKIKISSSSILGGKVIEVIYGSSGRYYSNHDTVQVIEEQSLTSFISSEYTLLRQKLADYSVHIDSIMLGLDRVMSRENTENIAKTLDNLKKLSSSLSILLESKSQNISNLIENLDTLSFALSQAGPSLKETIDKVNVASDSIPALIANANNAVNTLNSILNKINSAEGGNLSMLLNDRELYSSINSAVKSLDSLLTDLKLHPKRYINVTVFGKKDKSSVDNNQVVN